ncbi:hypothetical protein [Streptomyces sp. NPDC049916]
MSSMLSHAFAQTPTGTLSVSVRDDAPGTLELGSLDARAARQLIRALQV